MFAGDYPDTVPCSTHDADHPRGVTCTFIRRRQLVQNRGGSMASRTRQVA